VEEVRAIRALPKITSFFKPDADNHVLDLPDDPLPGLQPDDSATFEEVTPALSRESLENFIEYIFGRCEQSSHFNSLLLRKAILHYVSLHNNNIKQSALLITSLAVAAGSRELNIVLQERWISNIKYSNRTAFKVEGIDLEGFVSHFLENSNINFKRESAAHKTRTGNPGGIKPVWGQLEIQLTDYIVTMCAQRKAVNRIVVLHKALELVQISWVVFSTLNFRSEL
jgi:hypothetical protein